MSQQTISAEELEKFTTQHRREILFYIHQLINDGERVSVVDPFDIKNFAKILEDELVTEEPSVIIARRPCELLLKGTRDTCHIDSEVCLRCGKCLRIGCPAIEKTGIGKPPKIRSELCVGCGLCIKVCDHDGFITKVGE